MEILRAGAQLLTTAQRKLDTTAHRIVQNPHDPGPLVDLHLHETEAKLGATLLRKGQDLTDHLLDVLG